MSNLLKSCVSLQFFGASAAVVCLSLVGAEAQALSITGTSGTFSNEVGGTNVIYESDAVYWGQPTTALGQSGLGFTGVG